MSWEKQIRTGHPQGDQAELAQLQAQAQAQGLQLQVTSLPQGGLHVRAVAPAQGYGQSPYGAPPQQPYGAPSSQGYGAPSSQGYGPPPQQQQQQFGGAAFGAAGAFGAQPALAHAGFSSGSQGGFHSQASPAAGSMTDDRLSYIRKVYAYLSASALIAVGAGWLSTSSLFGVITEEIDGTAIDIPVLPYIMLQSPMIMLIAFGLLLASTFVAGAMSKTKGWNVVALFGVAGLMGVQLAPMVFVAELMAGFGATMTANPVRDAMLMVIGIFGSLTAYVFITKKDFSFLKATLSMGTWIIFGACLLTFLFNSEPFALAVASGGAVLSIGWLLYETSRLFKTSDMSDPVGDALGFLIQLRNLFMFILRILMSSRR